MCHAACCSRQSQQPVPILLIVFLSTSFSVSYYCVQTRGDVYSAETSKSTALGGNLVTPLSLLLPARLMSNPGPHTGSQEAGRGNVFHINPIGACPSRIIQSEFVKGDT